MVCVVGRMRDLILQLSKSSIYSTKPIISAGMGFLNSRDRVPSYEATFHQVPFRHDLWWKAITKSLGKHNRCATISQLMQSSPNDEYLIAASPVYIAAVQNDILKGIESLTHPLTQLTIVTSGAYAGPLEEYLIKSSSRMMKELGKVRTSS